MTAHPVHVDEYTPLIEDLVMAWSGTKPLRVEHMTMGHHHLTFDVRLPTRSVIVRTNADVTQLRHTERNLTTLGALGLPTPQVVTSDLTCHKYPWAYLILDRLPGRDLFFELDALTPAQRDLVSQQLVDYQRRVATLPLGEGFGWAPIGQPASYHSWTTLLFDKLDRHLGILGAHVSYTLADRLRSALHDLDPYFETLPPRPFLDDLTTRNVLIEAGRVSGIVDFDVIGYGDPLLWLALVQMAVTSSNEPTAARAYVASLSNAWGLNSDTQRVLDTYTALFGLDFASESHRVSADDIARHVHLAEVFLERAGA